jgi:predicted O-methyltransferase YrrM
LSTDATQPAELAEAVANDIGSGFQNRTKRGNAGLLWIYSATIFLSAFLLFMVQPLFSKMVLPLLGGTPAVWNTCMLFFQAALLGGYLYAHLGSRWLGVRRHAVVHLLLLAVALAALPIALPGWVPDPSASPVPWLLGVLTVSLGLPFFAISASGPLLQKWFSETGHPDSDNPYFLYAASNIGSLFALLGYPLLIEPRLRLAEQSLWWSVGYSSLLVLFLGCAIVLIRRSAKDGPSALTSAPIERRRGSEHSAPDMRTRAIWVLLAFVPSSLLLGVTGFLTTDVAAVPLLWILPLALYLLTFVLVFARRQVIPHPWLVRAQPFFGLLLLLLMAWSINSPATLIYPLHLLTFFVLAMVAHGELVRRKPTAQHLTGFYLWMSVGGVLGGVFNVIVAPNIFDAMLEYPIVIALACAIRPSSPGGLTMGGRRLLAVVLGLLVGVLAAGGFLLPDGRQFLAGALPLIVVLGSIAALRDRRLFAMGMAAMAMLAYAAATWLNPTIHHERTFFAVHRVIQDPTGSFVLYSHGNTVHGVQARDPERRTMPIGYYSETGPLGPIFSTLPRHGGVREVGVVGLGTGGMACHAKASERWTFYEIDPAVERIARDPSLFSFLADCAPSSPVILGDARITLADAADGGYDLLFLDAFTSDAIPAHLLTREALELYLTKTRAEGVVIFNISNRHLDLEPMLARLAETAGLVAMVGEYIPTEEEASMQIFSSRWVAIARNARDLGSLPQSPLWRPASVEPGVDFWTDDFSNILSVLTWR